MRREKAPFEHPERTIPNGHLLREAAITDLDLDGKADDAALIIAPVGAGGRSMLSGPRRTFLRSSRLGVGSRDPL